MQMPLNPFFCYYFSKWFNSIMLIIYPDPQFIWSYLLDVMSVLVIDAESVIEKHSKKTMLALIHGEFGNDLSEVTSPCSYSSTHNVIFIVVVFHCTI